MRTSISRLLVLSFALLALFATAGCQSGPPGRSMEEMFDGGGDWTLGKTEDHPALLEGYQLQWWTRGTGPSREKIGTITRKKTSEEGVRPEDLQALVKYCKPIDGVHSAHQFGHLARILDAEGLPIEGTPIDPDPTLNGMGGNGFYSRADARAWGIDFDPPGVPTGGGWEMERVLLVEPWEHPDLKYKSPYKVVWARGIVYPDGHVTLLEHKTLTNGDDAQRFLKF